MFFRKLIGSVLSFLVPGNIGRIFSFLGTQWKGEDWGGRFLILLFFGPSLCALCGLLLYIAYVVVFKLPSILLTIIGLVFLFALFWAGAVYLYEKVRGPMSTGPAPSSGSSDSRGGTWDVRGPHR